MQKSSSRGRFTSHGSETSLEALERAASSIERAASSELRPVDVELPPVDADRHRYPCCIVWTPIHPITWLCPYVGHVGLCDAEGRVHDFAGPYYIGLDAMAFGWPTRYVQLDCDSMPHWDLSVGRAAQRFERQTYDFLSWNCHAFPAHVLNETGASRDALARRLGGHTVVGVAARLFFRGRYTGVGGFLLTWGGNLLIWLGVVASCASQRSLEPMRGWAIALAVSNAFFILWFFALTACGLNSQFGRTATDDESPRSLEEDF